MFLLYVCIHICVNIHSTCAYVPSPSLLVCFSFPWYTVLDQVKDQIEEVDKWEPNLQEIFSL